MADHRRVGTYERVDYIDIVRRHRLSLGLAVLLGVLAGIAAHTLLPRTYVAQTAVVVGVGKVNNVQDALAADTAAQGGAKTAAYLGGSALVAQDVAARLGEGDTPDALLQRVKVTNELGSSLVTVAASSPTAEGSVRLADAWVLAMRRAFETPRGGQSMTLDRLGPTPVPQSPEGRPLAIEVAAGLGAALVVWGVWVQARGRRSELDEDE